jgi:NAD(P)-dependent dehydrogenase (short-subunit alcohol dehydrogenase family)
MRPPDAKPSRTLRVVKDKVVVVTGGNTGIGKEAARALAKMGAQVAIGARDHAKGQAAADEIGARFFHLDLADFASIRAFAQEILAAYDRLDVLLLNAGLVLGDRRETKQGFEQTFGVNHLGHFLLTDLLLERVKASAPSRIVVVASDAHRRAHGMTWDDLQHTRSYSGVDVYSESKLANILFARELARRLEGTGVTVNSLHPGVIASGFARDGDLKGIFGLLWKIGAPFMKTPVQGAQTSIHLCSSPEVEGVTGEYFKDSKITKPTRFARDDAAARRLWDESERLIAIRSHDVR